MGMAMGGGYRQNQASSLFVSLFFSSSSIVPEAILWYTLFVVQ